MDFMFINHMHQLVSNPCLVSSPLPLLSSKVWLETPRSLDAWPLSRLRTRSCTRVSIRIPYAITCPINVILIPLSVVDSLQKLVVGLGDRLKSLEGKCGGAPSACPKAAAAPAPTKAAAADDDDMDLFGSDDEEDAEAAAVREKRLAEYAAKKSKKPALIAKSNIIFDIKPWDDETDMKAMEAHVRSVQCDGLLWGVSKLVPLAYGIHKIQITCVVEDEKVSIDWVQEEIEKNEDLVQSVDIAAFNKI